MERGTHIDCDPSFKPKADDYNAYDLGETFSGGGV